MSRRSFPGTPDDYLRSYSLHSEPFAQDLDGRFFYAGSALLQRLDLLTHLTQFGDSVILVSGPAGSGKTTLLGRFAAQAARQWCLCLLGANEFQNFRQQLAASLSVEAQQDADAIISRWIDTTDLSQLLVIVIDNAEQLDAAAFMQLCSLLRSQFSDRLRLVLFGSPDTQLVLKQVLDRKEIGCTTQLLEMPRLSEEETSAYLMYRLAVAGYSGESPFTATEVRAICKAADGRPAQINALAHDALLEHQARRHSKRLQPAHHPRRFGLRVWAPASLAIIGFALYLGWQRLQPPAGQGIPIELGDSQELALALPKTVTPQTPTAPAAASSSPPPIDLPDTTVNQVQPPLGPDDTESGVAAPAFADSAPAAPDIPPAATAASVAATEPQLAAVTPPGEPAAATAPVAADIPAPSAASGSDTTAAASLPPPTPGLHREDWLLEQPGNRFSLQLLGSRREAAMVEYIHKYQLDPQQAAYYQGVYRDTPWYVLMYGLYPDRQAARQARDALPSEVRNDQPWPRDLASVHAAIRAAP
jgi:DamX protein